MRIGRIAEEAGWSSRVAAAVCVVPVLVALAVAVQRDAIADPGWSTVLVVAGALPWVLLALGILMPAWLIGVIEVGVTLGLLQSPVTDDISPFFLLFTVAVFAAVKAPVASASMLAASCAVMVGVDLANTFQGGLIWSLGIVLGWFGGYSLRLQQHAHAAASQRAAAEERQRIARELHDVVAHSLAVTMLHLTGARLALRRDPAEAEAALRQAEESGRQSMNDIRRAVGLLGPTSTASRMPGAADVGELVDEFVRAGLPVKLSLEGDVLCVPDAVGLALYRIIQESLANVAKHAPGVGASVSVMVGDVSVCASVKNHVTNGAARNRGLGLAGMQERAALVGGTLRAEVVEGEWSVITELPLRSGS